MLAKLLKYDLKRMYRQIIVVYLLALAAALLTRLTDFSLDGDATVITVLHVLCYNAAYILCVGIAFMTCIIVWRDFRRQMYGDESYLTHTLPITIKTLWGAKFIESIMMVLSSVLVVGVVILIMSGTNGSVNVAQMVFGYNNEGVAQLFALAVAVLMQWTFIMQSGLVGIIIANRMPERRGLHAVAWGMIIYMTGIVAMLLVLLIWDRITFVDISITESLETQIARSQSMMLSMFYGVGALYVVLTALTYLLNYKILSRGVNID